MSLNSLHQRIDKMLAAIEQQRGPEPTGFHFHLFTEQEQLELQLFLDRIELKIPEGDTRPFQYLSDSEPDRGRTRITAKIYHKPLDPLYKPIGSVAAEAQSDVRNA